MKTDFETLRTLAVYIVNLLKEKGFISFPIDKRAELIEALATELAVSFATDEDIRDQAIEEVEEKFGEDNLPENITETEMFNHARKEIIKAFNGETIGGLYLVESLNLIAKRLNEFVINSDLIEDVFGTDEDICDFLVAKVRHFSNKRS